MIDKPVFERPVLHPKKKWIDYFFEVMALVLMAFMWVFAWYHFKNLPDIIPTHFGLNGKADDWGSKNSIWILPAIVTTIVLLFRILSRYPHKFNYPVKLDENNVERQYTIATRLMRYMQFMITLLFCFIHISIVKSAYNGSTGMSVWFIFIMLPGLFVPTVYTVYTAMKK